MPGEKYPCFVVAWLAQRIVVQIVSAVAQIESAHVGNFLIYRDSFFVVRPEENKVLWVSDYFDVFVQTLQFVRRVARFVRESLLELPIEDDADPDSSLSPSFEYFVQSPSGVKLL